MSHDVFISYSTKKDHDAANAVVKGLEKRGLKCWVAPRDIEAGLDYAEQIIYGILNSRFVLLILSSESNRSGHVLREIENAASADIDIIQFRIENVELTPSLRFFLSTRHWIEAYTTPLDEHIEKLANVIKSKLKKEKEAKILRTVALAKKALFSEDYTLAKKYFREVLEIDGKNADALKSLKEIEQIVVAIEIGIAEGLDSSRKEFDTGNYTQARVHIEKVLKLDSQNEEALGLIKEIEQKEKERDKNIENFIDLAEKALIAKNLVQARAYVEKALKLDSRDTATISMLERIDRKEKEKDEKIAERLDLVKKAIISKNYTQARKHVEEIFSIDGGNQEASRMLEKIDREVKERNQKIAEGLALGSKAFASGYNREAKSFFEKVLQLDPYSREALSSLEKINRLEKDKIPPPPPPPPGGTGFPKAISVFIAVVLVLAIGVSAVYLIYPPKPQTEIDKYLNLAAESMRLQDLGQAKIYFKEVLLLDSNNKKALTSRAEIEKREIKNAELIINGKKSLEAGNLEVAREIFISVLKYDSKNHEARSYLEEVGRLEKEWKIRVRIAELTAAAEEALKAGNYNQAQKAMDEIGSLDPENKDALRSIEAIDRLITEQKIANLINLARKGLDAKNYELATKASYQIRDLDPENKDAVRLLKKIDRLKSEEEEEVAENNRRTIANLINLGEKEFDANNYQLARKYFESALELDPHNREAIQGLKKTRLGIVPDTGWAAAIKLSREGLNFGRITKERPEVIKTIRIISNVKNLSDFKLITAESASNRKLSNSELKDFLYHKWTIEPNNAYQLKAILTIPMDSKLSKGKHTGALIFHDEESDKHYSVPFKFLFKP